MNWRQRSGHPTSPWSPKRKPPSLLLSAGFGRRRSVVPRAEPRFGSVVVLDPEALSVLAAPKERGVSARRAQAVLVVIERRGGYAIVPAPVLAEASRTRARRDAVARVLRRFEVIATDRRIAETAALLLEGAGFDSSNAIDAFVVATAAVRHSAVVLTGDPADLERLAAPVGNVTVRAL